MKIGFVGSANTTINCRPDKSFRLASYTEEKALETIESNLACIQKTIDFCIRNHLYFYRIADFIPFFSHSNSIPWFHIEEAFSELFLEIGKRIRNNNMRISMHPGQYTILNSPKEEVLNKSIKELEANVWILDQLKLDRTAKVQIHVGGIYGNKEEATRRFIKNFQHLPEIIKNRIVIENDDRLFDFKDCTALSKELNVPIVFDVFHHTIRNNQESTLESLNILEDLWDNKDGIPMVDWSYQELDARMGKHANTIDLKLFENFISEISDKDFDLMLEIRDKEKSAIQAAKLLRTLGRL
ncbi:MAG: UV DNA damage repair endonuclease UvsE [Candidatus Hodarchaeales archaeon]